MPCNSWLRHLLQAAPANRLDGMLKIPTLIEPIVRLATAGDATAALAYV